MLLVIYSHLPISDASPATRQIAAVLRPGHLGVAVFFVLSGFLITRILLFNRENGLSLPGFLLRRAARIFPIFYLTILVCALLYPGAYLWVCAFYVSNFAFAFANYPPQPLGHTWSLCVEEHFYMVWPLLVMFAPARWLLTLVVGTVVGGVVVALGVACFYGRTDAVNITYYITFTNMTMLALGGWLAISESSLRDRRVAARVLLALALAAVVGMGASLLLESSSFLAVSRHVGFSALAGLAFVGTIWLGRTLPWFAAAMGTGLLAWIGRVSYGLYLYHNVVFFMTGTRDGTSPVWVWWLSFAGTFLLAALSYRFLEAPLLAWARKRTAPAK